MAGKNSAEMTFTLRGDREIVMTRIFDAPRELVWKAYTDPKHIPHWVGPRSDTTTVDKMDVRPGGVWHFILRSPDGNEYALRGVYQEVVPSERLVYTHEFEGMPGHASLEAAIFEEHTGKTKVTNTSLYRSVRDRDGMFQGSKEEGARESWDRMAELLDGQQEEPALVITRIFDAPRALVWKAWTDPEHAKKWWGPKTSPRQ